MKIKIIKDDVVICFETKTDNIFLEIKNTLEQNGITDSEWTIVSGMDFRFMDSNENYFYRSGIKYSVVHTKVEDCDILITE